MLGLKLIHVSKRDHRCSATMILNVPNELVFVFHKKEFQLHVPFSFWEMIENEDIFSETI